MLGYAAKERVAGRGLPFVKSISADRRGSREIVKLVRVLKRWNRDMAVGMKSLFVEVLALSHLEPGTRADALARFFAAGTVAILGPVEDPAGLCGEIQPDLDRQAAKLVFNGAADLSWRAIEAAKGGDSAAAPRVTGGRSSDRSFQSPTGVVRIVGRHSALPHLCSLLHVQSATLLRVYDRGGDSMV